MLGALCGVPEPEPDDAVREALAEAVLCLARVDSARKALWRVDAPTLLAKVCAGAEGVLRGAGHGAEHVAACRAREANVCGGAELLPLVLVVQGYEWEENPTVCRCMEAAAELFLEDGFAPAPPDAAAEGGQAGEHAVEGAAANGAGAAGHAPLPPPGQPHIVEID